MTGSIPLPNVLPQFWRLQSIHNQVQRFIKWVQGPFCQLPEGRDQKKMRMKREMRMTKTRMVMNSSCQQEVHPGQGGVEQDLGGKGQRRRQPPELPSIFVKWCKREGARCWYLLPTLLRDQVKWPECVCVSVCPCVFVNIYLRVCVSLFLCLCLCQCVMCIICPCVSHLTCAEICKGVPLGVLPALGGLHENKGNWKTI